MNDNANRHSTAAIQGGSTLGSLDSVDRDRFVDCERNAQILLEKANLRDSIQGSIVRTLNSGEVVFICGMKNGWFRYGYVEANYPIDCPDIPNEDNKCFIGWSEFKLKTMIAG